MKASYTKQRRYEITIHVVTLELQTQDTTPPPRPAPPSSVVYLLCSVPAPGARGEPMRVTGVRGRSVEHAHCMWAWEAGHETWHRASVGVHHAHCRRQHRRRAHRHLRHLRCDVACHRRRRGDHRCGRRWGSPVLRGSVSVVGAPARLEAAGDVHISCPLYRARLASRRTSPRTQRPGRLYRGGGRRAHPQSSRACRFVCFRRGRTKPKSEGTVDVAWSGGSTDRLYR